MKLEKKTQKSTSKIVNGTIITNTMRSVATTRQQANNKVTNNNNPLGLVKKKSCTALLCELTCLKSQQKYLECSQVKLNPANYEDPPASATNDNGTTAIPQTKYGSVATQMVNEVETIKVQLHEDLLVYRENSYREVQDLRDLVSSIREDVRKPERLSQYTLPALRERIISINTQLMQLCDKNQAELERLREECDKLERDNDILVKV